MLLVQRAGIWEEAGAYHKIARIVLVAHQEDVFLPNVPVDDALLLAVQVPESVQDLSHNHHSLAFRKVPNRTGRGTLDGHEKGGGG